MKITYLFTIFPLLSEKFLQREVEAMRELGVELELFSLFGGKGEFQGMPVVRFRWWHWSLLPWALVREFACRPRAFHRLGRALLRRRPAEPINLGENLLGFAFAVIWAPYFRRTRRDQLHAVWATAPGAAAILLKELTGEMFSLGAHAYDVFRHGGDWILQEKLRAATLIHTSTEATKRELLERGASVERVVMIRRGLTSFTEMKPVRRERTTEAIRLLSVGRLIEKKGFNELLAICAALKARGVPFECRIVGGGYLFKTLQVLKQRLDLDECVRLTGAQSYENVTEFYRWADLFCFTGKIATSNDRDGLPNVIAEAMAVGLPVISAPVSGTVEAIEHGVSGYLIDPKESGEWIQAIRRLRENDEIYEALRTKARAWVEANFDARVNAERLLEAFAKPVKRARESEKSFP